MLERQSRGGMPYLQETLLPAQADDVLELDELWSYVQCKKNKVWIWIALCRRTRQVVAWHFGPRDELSCSSLWDKIPPDYKALMCYSDFWDSYPKSHSPAAAQSVRQRRGRNKPCRALQLDFAPKSAPLCSQDAFVFQRTDLASQTSPLLSRQIQPLLHQTFQLTLSHYHLWFHRY